MSDRHTADSITSDALDQLYAELDRLTAELTDYDKRNQRLTTELRRYTDRESAEATADSYTHRAHHAETAIERVRHIANLIDAGAPWTANHHDTANRIREALDGEQAIEPALAATEATEAQS